MWYVSRSKGSAISRTGSFPSHDSLASPQLEACSMSPESVVIRTFKPSDIQFCLAAARRILYRQGCDSGIAGHVTVRAEDDPLCFWTTPMSYFDEALPADTAK